MAEFSAWVATDDLSFTFELARNSLGEGLERRSGLARRYERRREVCDNLGRFSHFETEEEWRELGVKH